ncbi:hypothetical protein CXB51_016858 [Gossypium anomalum]|uniref:Uncharacterized protein ycf72 n=1 Tax=Gossypium anomalum TaxID=47600 RepID=A0A8J6D0E5_9ROSI|nr:hypothetical protein CXB51_016858 [Gossypium anomalum]
MQVENPSKPCNVCMFFSIMDNDSMADHGGYNGRCSRLNNPKGLWVFFLLIGSLPSPPLWGWSIGFITTSLTMGCLPNQHLFAPTFPTCSTFAEQLLDIKRTSLEGNFNVADLPSLAINFATCCSK